MKKKIVPILIILCLSFLVWPAPSELIAYENPQTIIIATPENQTKTSSEKISIYGACDYRYPLTMNGTTIPFTESGFFAQYVPLAIGSNTFTFVNNGVVKTVTIIREDKPASASAAIPSASFYTPLGGYAVVTADNITHRSGPHSSYELLEPLVKGTTCLITGQSGSYYRLVDGTYIFKSAVTYYGQSLQQNQVVAFKTTPLTENRSTEIRLKMPVKAYYDVDLQADRAVLTLYNTQAITPPPLLSNAIVKEAVLLSNKGAVHTQYSFLFQPEARVAGYYVDYRDEGLVIGFKHKPPVSAGSMEGIKVLLDAGHGGNEMGALGAPGKEGPAEKDLNLQITLFAKEYLEQVGATVVMTRTNDSYLSLNDRVRIIKAVMPDLAVSIHNNSIANTSDQTTVQGYLTCYSFTAQETAARYFTDTIAAALGRPQSGSGIYNSNLALTRVTNCPAVLLENAFLSNPQEYEWVLKTENQRALGREIGKAIEAYFQ